MTLLVCAQLAWSPLPYQPYPTPGLLGGTFTVATFTGAKSAEFSVDNGASWFPATLIGSVVVDPSFPANDMYTYDFSYPVTTNKNLTYKIQVRATDFADQVTQAGGDSQTPPSALALSLSSLEVTAEDLQAKWVVNGTVSPRTSPLPGFTTQAIDDNGVTLAISSKEGSITPPLANIAFRSAQYYPHHGRVSVVCINENGRFEATPVTPTSSGFTFHVRFSDPAINDLPFIISQVPLGVVLSIPKTETPVGRTTTCTDNVHTNLWCT